MKHPLVNLLVRWMVLALGVVLSARLVNGISYDSGLTLAVVVIVLSFFNAVIKPLLVLVTLPLIILSLGIGLWLINALLFYFAGNLVKGFHVSSFGTALLGALIVSLTSLMVNYLLARAGAPPPALPRRPDDVIDV